jgi:hypothetical protein
VQAYGREAERKDGREERERERAITSEQRGAAQMRVKTVSWTENLRGFGPCGQVQGECRRCRRSVPAEPAPPLLQLSCPRLVPHHPTMQRANEAQESEPHWTFRATHLDIFDKLLFALHKLETGSQQVALHGDQLIPVE